MLSDYCLEILFTGTNPITKGMKLVLINALLDAFVKKLMKLTTIGCFLTTEGILKIEAGSF